MDNYEEKYVAFIDVLGFKELVNNSESDPDLMKKLIYILNDIKSYSDYGKSLEGIDDSVNIKGLFKISTFSDSILISTKKDALGLMLIITLVCCMCSKLLLQGILTRGAISKGKLIHTDNIVLGNGLIKSYELESKTAIYPRVIIDTEVIDDYTKNVGINKTNSFIREDFDGISHVNILCVEVVQLASSVNSIQGDFIYSNFDLIIKNIESELKNQVSLSVKSKIFWLAKYINENSEKLHIRKIELA